MFGIVGSLQWIIFLLLTLVVFGVQLFALVDALRRPASAFTAEGKLTKPIWLAILGAAAVLGFLSLPLGGPNLGFLGLIAVVAAIVYLVDVRPRLQPYGNGRRGGSGGGRPSGW
ncbi:DUF2516 family protein [Cellulosimicrobium marinum]|uniref:DUF2516 family protein n=1 Tax=Cellulosimicrobium marinum TaxID=1638992 RepID=UPI0027E17630|nr:DUF2516 family protein [Cellulosimicrobium marinum]